ncbi:hypothetical protein PlfCFBP13513_17060 [Plantibacter flavus]|uniref:hypothetical protein n=1 Tax=Plantibacter TaxID=190323 RepID=UPI0010C209DC|nr:MULTISPECIES: hypothetical protein [Plantibacter]NUJ88828.1 hypothetical protein [Plantibacter sp. MCCC 1A11337]TKJ95535.1 hypothetical protein PlfCFBP13513_17060 [Plantibacter flavus]
MKNWKKAVAVVAVAGALIVGGGSAANAATTQFGSQTCSGGLRAAVYLGASGNMSLAQSWNGGNHSENWSNGSTSTTRVKVVPIGVATMTSGSGTYSSGWSQQGKDCRAW